MRFSQTENKALQYADTNHALVDFLRSAGSQRAMVLADSDNILELFLAAFALEPQSAVKLAFWLRDARQGAGERAAAYKIFTLLHQASPEFISDNLHNLLEVGYYRDLLHFDQDEKVLHFWAEQIRKKDRLATKWAPRLHSQHHEVAIQLQKLLGVTASQYRHLLKEQSETVEQEMCAQEWAKISYSNVPSLAMHRYHQAFTRHDQTRFTEWTLQKDSKANAAVLYPYQILGLLSQDLPLAEKLWVNLPNFIKPGERILPIVDVSGSMTAQVVPNVTALAIAVSLGIYVSERNLGQFKDRLITFSAAPELISMTDCHSLQERVHRVSNAEWGMNTDFEKAYMLILETAQMYHVPQEQMPTMLLCLSDMQFDSAANGEIHLTNIKEKFTQAGYKIPKLIFWNLREAFTGSPAMDNDTEVGLVSGFSPSLMKAILACEQLTPISLVYKVIEPYKNIVWEHLPALSALVPLVGMKLSQGTSSPT